MLTAIFSQLRTDEIHSSKMVNHNYIKILESNWSSTALISAVIGQLHTSSACNWIGQLHTSCACSGTVVRVMPE